MIEFEKILSDKKINGDSARIIDFTCYNCNHRYSGDSLNIAVFIYGFFNLHKRDLSYTGITCPSCLNTLLIKENKAPGSLFKKLSSEWSFGNYNIQPKLTYFTSIFHKELVGKRLPDLRKFNISYFSAGVDEDGQKFIDDEINTHISENSLENHLSSFVDAGSPFPPVELLLLYVDEKHIKDLVKYEQDHSIRIIPRYTHRNDLNERIEEFCARYGFDNPIERMMGAAKENFESLKKIAEENNLNLEKILRDNPNIQTPDLMESVMQGVHQQPDIDFGATSEFMNILVSDPYPWDLFGLKHDWIRSFWKCHHPFKDQELPVNIENISAPYMGKKASEKRERIVNEIKKVFSKGYIQKVLSDQYPRFIKEYSRIVNGYAFSYADIWQFKERYLEGVYECIQDKKSTRPSYRHKRECRKIAKLIWSKNPEITIADMILSNDINKACDGHLYDEKVLRSWINDLCPDRSPGRRSSKNQIR